MLKALYSSEKTNSFRPVPWHWSETPFPAFRGEGARHRGFLAVGRGYIPNFFVAPAADGYNCPQVGFDTTLSRVIKTHEKGTLLLVPCSSEQDEQVMLLTLRGGFRGGYSRIEARGAEILVRQGSNMHCCPTAHLVVRLTHPLGYVFAETGRRCSTGLVEIFSWNGIVEMPTEEFEAWLSSHAPDLADASRADAKAQAEADRKAAVAQGKAERAEAEADAKAKAEAEIVRKAEAVRMRALLAPRLEAVSRRRQAIGLLPISLREERWSDDRYSYEYAEQSAARAEEEIVKAEAKDVQKKTFEAAVTAVRSRMEVAGLDVETLVAAVKRADEYSADRWLTVQREKKFPQDQKVADAREADPPATPNPVTWGFDLTTGEAKTAYAALVHSVHGVKGRIVDSGWFICWFDDAEEAAKADAEARREAESYVTARRLEAELLADAKAELPIPLPPAFTTPELPEVGEILRMLLGEGNFRMVEDPKRMEVREESFPQLLPREYWGNSSSSKYSTTYTTRKVEERWWREGEVIVVSSLATTEWLLREEYGVPSPAEKFATVEKITAVRELIRQKNLEAENDYRAVVREFIQHLQMEPAFSALSLEAQNVLVGMLHPEAYTTLTLVEREEWLCKEWGQAEALQRRMERGEILVNFGGHYRVMGATGNRDYWVVCADGTLRDSDTIEYRKRYTSEGEKQWRLVGPEELAITWSKGYTAAPHEFVVNKLPVGGCTVEQLVTVERIEREISERFYGAMGISGAISPEIGDGWGLRKKSDPKSAPAAPEEVPGKPLTAEETADFREQLRKKFGGR